MSHNHLAGEGFCLDVYENIIFMKRNKTKCEKDKVCLYMGQTSLFLCISFNIFIENETFYLIEQLCLLLHISLLQVAGMLHLFIYLFMANLIILMNYISSLYEASDTSQRAQLWVQCPATLKWNLFWQGYLCLDP